MLLTTLRSSLTPVESLGSLSIYSYCVNPSMKKIKESTLKDYGILFEQIKPNRNDTKFEKVIKLAKEKIGENIILVVILRKKNDQSFKLPLQGKYLSDIKDFKTSYQEQNLGSQVALNQIADNDKRK